MKKKNFKALICCLLLITIISIPLVASAANLWIFEFKVGDYTFPNPSTRNSVVKERINLCVMDTNNQLHQATIRSKVYNINGQLVYTKAELHDSSPSFDMVVWNTGNVASGIYIIKTRAETSFGVNSKWVERKCTIVN